MIKCPNCGGENIRIPWEGNLTDGTARYTSVPEELAIWIECTDCWKAVEAFYKIGEIVGEEELNKRSQNVHEKEEFE